MKPAFPTRNYFMWHSYLSHRARKQKYERNTIRMKRKGLKKNHEIMQVCLNAFFERNKTISPREHTVISIRYLGIRGF